MICRAICGCNNAHNGTQRVSQWCVTLALWEYDKALSYQSTIKAEVPYDMSQNPPAPIMSKNVPQRSTHSKPGGTQIPDVVVVYDPTKPPVQGNIKKIYEIKFGDDGMTKEQLKQYPIIAGTAPIEVLTPKECGCDDDNKSEPLPERISARDAAEIILLLLMAVALLVDDAAPGGQADDVLIPEVVRRLLIRLAPILSKIKPVYPPMLPAP